MRRRPWALPAALLVTLASLGATAQPLPLPGAPERLLDWRWLARPPEGRRVTVAGEEKLESREGAYQLLEVTGPGVLDHVLLRDGQATLTLSADGRVLWQGKAADLATPPAGTTPLFPTPIAGSGGAFLHLLAPVGFRTSLTLLTDRPQLWRYLSYRTFDNPPAVAPAEAGAEGAYARGLREAAQVWKASMDTFGGAAVAPAREVRAALSVPAGGTQELLAVPGAGEITHLRFELLPALAGSLRELVLEARYDGATEPALRLPLLEFVGMPHPWPNGRWDTLSGTLAAGLRLPWTDERRMVHREIVLYSNLPMPFSQGLALRLVNRSPDRLFYGWLQAVVAPAAEDERAGRLCGMRVQTLLSTPPDTPLLRVPGPGQLVSVGFFGTGNELYPPPQRDGSAWLALDGAPALRSPAVAPLWMCGGGPITGPPGWSHPRLERGYVGVRRDFLTDPQPFEREAAFGYDPGPDPSGAPTSATVIALWYSAPGTAYVAPALPPRAEALPYTTYVKSDRVVPVKDAVTALAFEAEDLAALATAHGGEVLSVADPDHNYHASGGHYLTIRASRIGDYADCPAPLPNSRYFVLGSAGLTGPVDGMGHFSFELAFLSREAAATPPSWQRMSDFAWSLLGGVPMGLAIHMAGAGGYRRDVPGFYAPQLNPAPGEQGVWRFIRRGPGAPMIRLDQFWLVAPPPAATGWQEAEEGVLPTCSGGVSAALPQTGRLEWSGWGAVVLESKAAGRADWSALCLTGPATPKELVLAGSLPPGAGEWRVAPRGSATPGVLLTPGKDANEVIQWRVPLGGVALPGPISLDMTYTPPVGVSPPPASRLYLDAWSVP